MTAQRILLGTKIGSVRRDRTYRRTGLERAGNGFRAGGLSELAGLDIVALQDARSDIMTDTHDRHPKAPGAASIRCHRVHRRTLLGAGLFRSPHTG
jgi:hypothetical protein